MPNFGDGNKWPLIIFVAVCATNMAVLAVDELLDRQGMTTVTELARAHPVVAVPIILLQMIATIALAYHFWVSKSLPHI